VPYGQPYPSVFARYRQTPDGLGLLPPTLRFHICFPFACTGLVFHIDARKVGESLLLFGSLSYASWNLSDNAHDYTQPEAWISLGPLCLRSKCLTCLYDDAELYILIIVSLIYTAWTHISLYKQTPPLSTASSQRHRTTSQRPSEGRDIRRSGVATSSSMQKEHFSFFWMTVPKNYR
jgi:hypothetical protein